MYNCKTFPEVLRNRAGIKQMKKIGLIVFCVTIFALSISAQENKPKETAKPAETKTVTKTETKTETTTSATPKTVTWKTDATPLELAKVAIEAHGGDKFKQLKNLKMLGTVDVSSTSFPGLSGSFAQFIEGEKYRLEINSPFINFAQASDGSETYSTLNNGVTIPPINRIGLPLLLKIEDKGFSVEAGGDKKKRGFKVNTPDGYAVNYFLDEKTGQVKSYDAVFNINGREITTAVENDKYKLVDGVWLPEKFSQRFDVQGITAYAAFKVKDLAVNSTISEDIFTKVK